MGFSKALLVLTVIPLVGFGVATWVLSQYDQPFEQRADFGVTEFCAEARELADPDIATICKRVGRIQLLRRASIGSALVGVALVLVFALAAAVAGTDRNRITRIFPPLVFVSLVLLAGLVLVHGAILTYAAYVLEATAIGQVHYFIIGFIGLGALLGGAGLVRSALRLSGQQAHSVVGIALEPAEQPAVFAFAADIAGTLGARRPDHIVVGLEPNFYVTSARVRLPDTRRELSGETLYLSLPLARIFTKDEIRAVIGHELGHFRGQDTFYSLKFAPVYAGLGHGVEAMRGSGDLLDLARLPAKVLLQYMIDVFHRNVSLISREREFAADRAAAEVAPPIALATALLKIGLYANAWNKLQETIIERMGKRKIAHNLSSLFASIVKYDVSEEKIPEALNSVAQQHVAHPTDSHPTTASRIREAGVDMEAIDHTWLLVGADNSIDLFVDYRSIEEQLTRIQQQYYVAMGVHVPEAGDSDQSGTLIAALGAHMVLADGKVEPAEIDHAEAVGMRMSSAFDYIEFREFCHYPEHTPALDHLLDAARDVSDDAKRAVFEYLALIAAADDETSPEESELLARVSRAFWPR